MKVKTAEQALAALMFMCARAEKSSGDALRLMRLWQVPEADRAPVLDKLLAQKFIDDSRYAAAYVREKSRLNGWGEYKIRQQLAQKGIARDVADEALRQLDDIPARLDEMLARKMRTLRAKDDFELRGKLFRYGMSLGYGYDDVMQTLERVISLGGER
jgi:regulatory protein